MEETPEGLAAAAATRAAAKRKREESPPAPEQPAKRMTRPPPSMVHDVSIPDTFDRNEVVFDEAVHGTLENPTYNGEMAKQYPFPLDPFQSVSIACLERKECVMVAAHTSAGKTVVAEYAIAMSFRDKQRVIYTSPLKALSNQKFRELSEEFGGEGGVDVGLMTGDVSLNPNANCVIMTTEILRSMLYRGSELMREVAWVIFDEVHYMQDRERGVVWEEIMIFLPPAVKMIFLSATLSNSREFIDWIAYLRKEPCHVVTTDYRPVPLQHYAFPMGGKGLYLIVDERGQFRQDNYEKLVQSLGGAKDEAAGENGAGDGGEEPGGRGGRGGRGRGGRGRGGRGGPGGGRGEGRGDIKTDIQGIVRLVKDRKLEPLIVFSFSRKECEQYARCLLQSKKNIIDFNTDEQRDNIKQVWTNAMAVLSEEDQALPALQEMLPILLRGIGVHHSGLLPVLKELIEILFQEQLLKCLFTTETFAMGLNMPARTVVFTAMKKWDGQENRFIESGEYIQMSGRAGRRGKDDRGMCIMMLDDKVDEGTLKGICQGKAAPLVSSFKLTYYTLLNLLRRMEGSEHTMEFVIRNSFQQFQQERAMPQLEARLATVEAEMDTLGREGDAALEEYQQLRTELALHKRRIREAIMMPDNIMVFLRPGRLLHIQDGNVDWGWGVVVSVIRNMAAAPVAPTASTPTPPSHPLDAYTIDVLLPVAPGSVQSNRPRPAKPGERDAEMHIIPTTPAVVDMVGMLRIGIPDDLRGINERQAVLLSLHNLLKRYPDGLPLLDPVEDMSISDPALVESVREAERLEALLVKNPVYQCEKDSAKFEVFVRKAALSQEAELLRSKLRHTQLSAYKEEAANRTKVLHKLGHVDADGVVQLKGRAACEIDTADELVATELLLDGTFSSLDKHKLVALASCLIPTEKSNEAVKLKSDLAGGLLQLQKCAQHIGETMQECKVQVDVAAYVESFRPFLMDVIYAWSKGATFATICGMTDLYEGSIIRATRRLDELMQQLARAAKAVGDNELAAKIEESNMTIRRDIMFSASLYV